EQPPATQRLAQRVINGHRRARNYVLIIDVRNDANDSPGFWTDINELHHRIAPHHVTIHRILVGKHPLRQALAHDHDFLRLAAVRVVEVAARNNRDSEGGEEPGRHSTETSTWIFFAVDLGVTFSCELKARAEA